MVQGLLKNQVSDAAGGMVRRPVERGEAGCGFVVMVQERGARRRNSARRQPAQEESGGEPLEVDRGRGQVGLDLHVGETAADRAGEAVPGLRFAMDHFHPLAVALIELPVLVRPPLTPAARSEQRRMIVASSRAGALGRSIARPAIHTQAAATMTTGHRAVAGGLPPSPDGMYSAFISGQSMPSGLALPRSAAPGRPWRGRWP
jgi:hypothetical protein